MATANPDAQANDLETQLSGAPEQADAYRHQGLLSLNLLLQARQEILRLEAARLSGSLPKGDPKLLAIAAKRQAGQAQVRELAFEIQRSLVQAPVIDPDHWVLHGFVFQKDDSPAAGLRVALLDDQEDLRGPGTHVPTDQTGYFTLSLGTVPANDPSGGSKKDAAQRPAVDGSWVTIVVRDASQAIVYQSPQTVQVRAGAASYCEIELGSGAGNTSDGTPDLPSSTVPPIVDVPGTPLPPVLVPKSGPASTPTGTVPAPSAPPAAPAPAPKSGSANTAPAAPAPAATPKPGASTPRPASPTGAADRPKAPAADPAPAPRPAAKPRKKSPDAGSNPGGKGNP